MGISRFSVFIFLFSKLNLANLHLGSKYESFPDTDITASYSIVNFVGQAINKRYDTVSCLVRCNLMADCFTATYSNTSTTKYCKMYLSQPKLVNNSLVNKKGVILFTKISKIL